MTGVQPVISDGKVFIGTLRGNFYGLNAETGQEEWRLQSGGAILHAAGCADGRVFFGNAAGTIYALRTRDGQKVWEVQTGSAVWNAPAIASDLVVVGSRDQRVYAIEAATGNVRWAAPTDGPLLGSPAVDAALGRVYVGSEDMRVYAFDLQDGREVWRSAKLPGVSLRGYHPVIAPDGSVLITTAPGISVDTFQGLLLEMAKEIFGDFASWRHSKEANAVLREENFALLQKPETSAAELSYLRKRLTEEPAFQTFFVLDAKTGRQKFVTPIVYSESMNGPGAPALVSGEAKVIVKFQALLRSRYEHYSPFLNVGELDTNTGDIRPLLDETRTYGWHDSLLLVHDEQAQLTLSGDILINTHQDNVNGLNLRTGDGFPAPFCQNIHEPKSQEGLAIWQNLLRGESLPPGKEWLARGTAVYGGGSVLDTSVAVAGDSFYYLPTHELNAGAALIAYRMASGGSGSTEHELPALELTSPEWARIQELPWDWDTLESRRLNHILEALPGNVPGTRSQPLTNEAHHAVAAIADAQLERVIWEARACPVVTPSAYTAGLKRDLAKAVEELIAQPWQPLLFPSGKFPEESYRFFAEPTETLWTLALAYPHLDETLKAAVRQHVQQMTGAGGPLQGPVGLRTYGSSAGPTRSAYDLPPARLLKMQPPLLRNSLARLYPLWCWAAVSGDWSKIERDWPQLAELLDQPPNQLEEDCRNGYLAGLIAYCRCAARMQDAKALSAGVAAAKAALRQRLQFELSHTRGGLIWQIPKMRSAFSRWHFLTPEVGRFLGRYARPVQVELMKRYVDYHRPTWWLAWNVETTMRNECPYEFPTVAADVFAARSLILNDSPEELGPCIDRPWCHGDEYYIQKLAQTIDAAEPANWVDLRAED